MTAIHLIERTDNVRKIDRNKNEWASGGWPVPEAVAQKLVGGMLYLHKGKQQPSHFGGQILSYELDEAGLVVFTLRAKMDCKDVATDRKGWVKDQKVFLDTPAVADA